MTDYEEGSKKQVAEVKFLIHDLRVEKFINEVIHFHVTLNTDLEIYDADQVQLLHNEDLRELKAKAVACRRARQRYANAVQSFSPDKTIMVEGRRYIQQVHEICDLILNPLWGRMDKVITFLPDDSRSVQSRNHYRNCIHWICGVYYRIEYFLQELEDEIVDECFDVSAELKDFAANVLYGYVVEKSSARVELQLGQMDSAVLEGNRYRFRRMFFNMVMNAVDAMAFRRVGVLNISVVVDGDRAVLQVRDTGAGMPPEKIQELTTDKESLDGELHSLGFVFVRQTIQQFGGELSIESEEGKGTVVTVRFPFQPDAIPTPRARWRCEDFEVHPLEEVVVAQGRRGARIGEATATAEEPAETATEILAEEQLDLDPDTVTDKRRIYGTLVHEDYQRSESEFPGSIFAMAVDDSNEIEFFAHRPYEKHWNLTHEDLSPMFYLATLRGRLEDDDERNPLLILKAPQNVREYFEFKELPDDERNTRRFVDMVHDEYVRVARKLIETGLDSNIGVQITDLAKFFPDARTLSDHKPFPLRSLAEQDLSSE